MKLISLTCPNCNANLDDIDSSRPFCYCQYCGTKIALDDGTIRKETHIYDEAKIKETESNELLKLKELEIEREREKEDKETGKKLLIVAVAIFVLAFILHFVLSVYSLIPTLLAFGGVIVGIEGLSKISPNRDNKK